MEGPASDHADVEVGEADRNEAAPGEQHVALVQETEGAPGFKTGSAEGRAGKAVELAAGQMTQRVARKGVKGKKTDVNGKDERANSDAEMSAEEERLNGVMPKEGDEEDRKIKKVAMDVLKDKGKRRLAAILAVRRFPDRAGRGIEEKRAVVGFAVVVARSAKAQRAGKNQERR